MIDTTSNQVNLGLLSGSNVSYILNIEPSSSPYISQLLSFAKTKLKQEQATNQYYIDQEKSLYHFHSDIIALPDKKIVVDALQTANSKLRQGNEDLDPHLADLVSNNFESLIWK